jgi:predicted ATPase
MITSLKFTGGKDSGYIVENKTKLVPKKKYEGWSEDDMRADMEKRKRKGYYVSYHWRDEYYKLVSDGKKNPQLVKNLLKREFKFSADKINILFGPNGSGKTTILKTIANYCMCGEQGSSDGYTNFKKFQPLDYGCSFNNPTKYSLDNLIKKINAKSNKAEIKWDGSPVYYENLAGRRQTGSIGDMAGSLFNDREEFEYLICKDKISQGQNSFVIVNQLIKICENIPTREYFDADLKRCEKSHNDVWMNAFTTNYEYIKSYGDGKGCMTLLLDELDKSMDISNVVRLYKELLPAIQKKYGVQIIIVSHSPLMLSNIIQENDAYNFISIDDDYTTTVKELYKGIKF